MTEKEKIRYVKVCSGHGIRYFEVPFSTDYHRVIRQVELAASKCRISAFAMYIGGHQVKSKKIMVTDWVAKELRTSNMITVVEITDCFKSERLGIDAE
jgi:hypothetical protein